MLALHKKFIFLLFTTAVIVGLLRDTLQWEVAFYSHIKKYPEGFSGRCDIIVASPLDAKRALEAKTFIAYRHPTCPVHNGRFFLAEQKVSDFTLDPILLLRGKGTFLTPKQAPTIRGLLHRALARWYNVTALQFYTLTQMTTNSCDKSANCVAAISPYGRFSSQLSGCDGYDNLQLSTKDFIYAGSLVGNVLPVNHLFYIAGKDLNYYYSIHLEKIRDTARVTCQLKFGFECFRVAAILSQKYSIKTCLIGSEDYLSHISQKIDRERLTLSRPALLYYKLSQQDFF